MKQTKIFLVLVLIAFVLDSCASGNGSQGNPAASNTKKTNSDKKTVVVKEEPAEIHEVVMQPVNGKFVGNIWANDTASIPMFKKMWGQVTPENSGKWSLTEPERDEMHWGDLDEAYNLAKENNLPFRYHTFIWGNQQPAWVLDLSPEEQLEEIEEFMRLVSERYPDMDMIDVVNEPLHAPPKYAGALSGNGASGWDWVIKSFEMARKYFPNAMLCLNEYGVMGSQENAAGYIKIIRLLQSKGLIDGAGMQGHFIEHTPTKTIKFNIDKIAETGIPLYVTEFDLEFTDDAMQAVRMRDIFPMFWEHEAIKGITLWGYKYGWMWRAKAYLMDKEGRPRPALLWLESFLTGTDYKIPRSKSGALMGTPDRVIMEAEDYTQAEGIEKSGKFVSQVDGGDTLMFEKVALRMKYAKVRVKYAKGSDTESKLLIRLKSPDSAPVAEVTLKTTGGWNEFADAVAEYNTSEEGFIDVYIECQGGEGIGNIDSIIIEIP